MNKKDMISHLEMTHTLFTNSTSCLAEEDSKYAPKEGMLTVSQHVAHVAQTIDWFMEPVSTGTGFDMAFEEIEKKIRKTTSLDSARQWLDNSIKSAVSFIEGQDEGYFTEPLPQGPIMGGEPKHSVFSALADHASHHRGALTVYSRLLGKTPKMPYGEI